MAYSSIVIVSAASAFGCLFVPDLRKLIMVIDVEYRITESYYAAIDPEKANLGTSQHVLNTASSTSPPANRLPIYSPNGILATHDCHGLHHTQSCRVLPVHLIVMRRYSTTHAYSSRDSHHSVTVWIPSSEGPLSCARVDIFFFFSFRSFISRLHTAPCPTTRASFKLTTQDDLYVPTTLLSALTASFLYSGSRATLTNTKLTKPHMYAPSFVSF